jgi:hypothetical protein
MKWFQVKFWLPVRITQAKRCREGFYLVVNGSRIRFPTHAQAISAAQHWVKLQRVQIVSLRDYARRLKRVP